MSVLVQQVTEVLEVHARRGQVLKLTEDQARADYHDLTVVSLGALKKEKADGSTLQEFYLAAHVVFQFTAVSESGTRSVPP